MNSRVSYAIVGLFVLLLGIAGSAAAVWLALGGTPQAYTTYVAYMRESVAGLNLNAPVRFRGVDVGRVAEINLLPEDPGRVELQLEIRSDAPINEDTVAVLTSQGITGLAFVELTGGNVDSAAISIPETGYSEIRTGPSLLVRLDTAASELMTEFRSMGSNLDGVVVRLSSLLDASNIEATTRVLANVEQLTAQLSKQVEGLSGTMNNLQTLTANAARTSDGFPALSEEVQLSLKAMRATSGAISRAARDFGSLSEVSQTEIREMSASVRAVSADVSRGALPELTLLLKQSRGLVDSLSRLSRTIERNPNVLLYGRAGRRGPGE